MPSMYEIYQSHAPKYDELVNAEDYRHNLRSWLRANIEWNGKQVVEAGIGTGRITRFYIDLVEAVFGYDRESHMLEQCRENLKEFSENLHLEKQENMQLKANPADIFIEGWSFGHTIIQNEDTFSSAVPQLMDRIFSCVKPGGTIIIVESEGTNVDAPKVKTPCLSRFYHVLENEYGFTHTTISTDYRFSSIEEASRIMGFFFGDAMGEDILRQKRTVIPEYTGIYTRKI